MWEVDLLFFFLGEPVGEEALRFFSFSLTLTLSGEGDRFLFSGEDARRCNFFFFFFLSGEVIWRSSESEESEESRMMGCLPSAFLLFSFAVVEVAEEEGGVVFFGSFSRSSFVTPVLLRNASTEG